MLVAPRLVLACSVVEVRWPGELSARTDETAGGVSDASQHNRSLRGQRVCDPSLLCSLATVLLATSVRPRLFLPLRSLLVRWLCHSRRICWLYDDRSHAWLAMILARILRAASERGKSEQQSPASLVAASLLPAASLLEHREHFDTNRIEPARPPASAAAFARIADASARSPLL